MTPLAHTERDKNHRCPGDIISHGVGLYYRVHLSDRDGQALRFERGSDGTYEAIRHGGLQCGQDDANPLRRRRPRPGDNGHLDAVFLTIPGTRHDLWRAVDQDNNLLDLLVQSRRNKKAAKQFLRKLLKGLLDVPRVVMTDKLKSYGAATREIRPGGAHRPSRYRTNRCANSHRPTRQREHRRQGCQAPGHAQPFRSAYGPLAQHVRPRRHLRPAAVYRDAMKHRFERGAAITGTKRAASRVDRTEERHPLA